VPGLSAFAASDIDSVDQLATQAEFRQLSEDLGAALSYKAVIPVASLGVTGFDVGFEVTATKIVNRAAWDRASSGDAPSTLYVPKVHIHKGLPLRLDVGAFYAQVPSSNISLWGAELRYALVEGGVATPAVGVRGTYSKLSGVNQLDFDTRGIELSISKGFTLLTPYAGIGHIWTDARPKNANNVTAEDFGLTKVYVGANFNLVVLNFAVEADRTGDANTYSAKIGWRF
jgi:hypothetical protein